MNNPILVLVMIVGAIIGVLVTHAPTRNEAKQRMYAELAARFPFEDIEDANVEAALDTCECFDHKRKCSLLAGMSVLLVLTCMMCGLIWISGEVK
jgi:hypothetical protein